MKYIIFIVGFILFGLVTKAQLPSGFPQQKSSGWFEQGYQMSDSATIIANRDTNWTPRFAGTIVLWQHAGVDTAYWFHSGSKWVKLADQSSIITNTNISNTSLTWNGNYVQNVNHKQLFLDTVNGFRVLANELSEDVPDRYTRTRIQFLNQFTASGPFFSYGLRNYTNIADSIFNSLSFQNGGIRLFTNHLKATKNLSAQVTADALTDTPIVNIFSNTSLPANLESRITVTPVDIKILTDSLKIKTATAASADSVLAVVGYDPITQARKMAFVPYNASASGTVTSVALSMPSAFTVTGSPITTNGTLSVSGAGTTLQYIRGNGTLATFDTSAIPSFSVKVRSLFSGTSPITYNQASGTFGLADIVTAGSCTGCTVTFNSKGQATFFSSGTGSGDTAINVGSGVGLFKEIIGDTFAFKSLTEGYGINITSNTDDVNVEVDTTLIVTQYDLTQIQPKAGYGIDVNSDTVKVDTTTIDARYPKVYNVKLYGATGDGIEAYDCSMTSGSSVLTVGAGRFVSEDVGKIIVVCGAASGGTDLVTTIAGYTSSTSITLGASASTTISDTTFKYGTDDTNPIQAAILECISNGGGKVWIPNGFYFIGGALKTNVDGVNPNCQIYVPATIYSDTTRTSIIIEGETPYNLTPSATAPGFNFIPTKKGTVLLSTITGSGVGPAVFGTKGTSSSFQNFNYTNVSFKNMMILVEGHVGTAGPTMGGLNFGKSTTLQVENVGVGIDASSTTSSEPTMDVAGIVLTQVNGEVQSFARNSYVCGFKYGLVIGEHAVIENTNVTGCYYGYVSMTGFHAWHATRILSNYTKYPLYIPVTGVLGYAPGACEFTISQFQIEVATSSGTWRDYDKIILDTNNFATGNLKYNIVEANVGINQALFNRVNGIKIEADPMGYAQYKNLTSATRSALTFQQNLVNRYQVGIDFDGLGQNYFYIYDYTNSKAKMFSAASDGALHLGSNAFTTPGLTIRDNGNVGIGNAGPNEKLVATGYSVLGGALSHTELFSGFNTLNTNALELNTGQASGGADNRFATISFVTNQSGTNNAVGAMFFANTAIGASDKRVVAQSVVTDGATNSGAMIWSTNNAGTFAERMRMKSNGNLLIGTPTDGGQKLQVAGTTYISGETNVGNSTDQGAFTLQNTGGLYQNGTFSLRGTLAGTSSMNVLVKGADSTVYQIPVSSIVPSMQSGRWLPTITAATNATGITVDSSQYIRQGDIVSFTVRVTLTITTGATPTGFDFSLPITSDIGVDEDLIAISSTSGGTAGYAYGDPTNETGEVSFTPANNGVVAVVITGHYKITPP